jgi:hypothetical protein
LSRFKSIESYVSLNERQIELIYDELHSHQFNGRYIYRQALAVVTDSFGFYQNYVDLMEPVNDAVNVLQVQ